MNLKEMITVPMSKESPPYILDHDEDGGLEGGSQANESQDSVLIGKSWLRVSVGRAEAGEGDSPPGTWVEA